MSKFKKATSKGPQTISTASLPDIVFMLLFFFMVSTVMREQSLKVKITVPDATEIKKRREAERAAMIEMLNLAQIHLMEENIVKQELLVDELVILLENETDPDKKIQIEERITACEYKINRYKDLMVAPNLKEAQ